MITGRVSGDLEAVISVRVGSEQIETTVDVIVDTGFSEYLTLPPSLIASLGIDVVVGGDVTIAPVN